MNASIAFIMCCIAGSTLAYYVQRETPYNTGPNDPYSVEVSPNLILEPSQRIFWGEGGSNQVGGNDWWSKITNKFPFLRFGRIQAEYGAPNSAPVFGTPTRYFPQFYTQNLPQFVPFARDIGFTDDAVIITPPNVPIAPQPLPQPVPQPAPQPGYQYSKPINRLELPKQSLK